MLLLGSQPDLVHLPHWVWAWAPGICTALSRPTMQPGKRILSYHLPRPGEVWRPKLTAARRSHPLPVDHQVTEILRDNLRFPLSEVLTFATPGRQMPGHGQLQICRPVKTAPFPSHPSLPFLPVHINPFLFSSDVVLRDAFPSLSSSKFSSLYDKHPLLAWTLQFHLQFFCSLHVSAHLFISTAQG